jgi:hypothetical protein
MVSCSSSSTLVASRSILLFEYGFYRVVLISRAVLVRLFAGWNCSMRVARHNTGMIHPRQIEELSKVYIEWHDCMNDESIPSWAMTSQPLQCT